MSLKTRIVLLCLFVMITGLITGGVGYVALDLVAKTYSPIATKNLPIVETIGNIRGSFRDLRINIRSIAFQDTNEEDVKKYVDLALKDVNTVNALFQNYQKLDENATQRASYKELVAAWDDFKSFGSILVEKSKNYDLNRKDIVHLIRNTCPVKAERMYKALAEETEIHLKEVEMVTSEAIKTENQSREIMFIIGMIATVLALIISYLFSKKLSDSVIRIANRINQANSEVTDSVHVMVKSGSDLTQSSSHAAATLDQTVTSLESLTAVVKQNTDRATKAVAISSASKESAENGEKDIKSLISSMHEISEYSKKIEAIITIIDDIAFQTNLLALNAAVEAARAGDQGKGFAVVAEAVRTLALRSSSAAKDISDLIKESAQKVEKGRNIADQSGVILNNIVSSVKQVSEINLEISGASKEQSLGIDSITSAMSELDQSSQGNTANAEGIAETSRKINNMANEALSLTKELNTLVHGDDEDNPYNKR